MKLTIIKNKSRKMGAMASIMAMSSTLMLPAQALDWGGYFRVGTGSSDKDVSRTCYGLNGPGLKYRLGNECDVYAEFSLSETFQAGDLEYKVLAMYDLYTPETNIGDAEVSKNQLYIEGKGFDVAPHTTFWIGERFHGRKDVHIVDTKFTILDGTGGGADIPIGAGTLGLSYFKKDESATDSGDRFNIDYSGIALNPGGSLRVIATFTDANFTGGESGSGLILQHDQKDFFGGENTLWLQYAEGSAGLDGNFGNLQADSDVSSWRIVENFNWQAGAFGGQAIALFQNDTAANGADTESISVGGRVSYAFTNNFKLVTELGYSEKKPDGAETQELTKFTIAPTLSIGPDFWSRPELRFYVTTANWNDAANSAAGPGGVTGAGDGKTSGTSYGVQVETWF